MTSCLCGLISEIDSSRMCSIFFLRSQARVAQWIERLPPEQEAAGSNPAAGTKLQGPPSAAFSNSVSAARVDTLQCVAYSQNRR